MSRDTNITLYRNVKLSLGGTDTYQWDNVNEQNTFFANRRALSFEAQSYQRDGRNYVRVKRPINGLLNIDYLSFVNRDYENKVFYCFVNAVNYINDETTEFVYTVDVMQTFYFDYGINPCFIERMHTPTDRPGDNLLNESFDLGEFVVNSYIPEVLQLKSLCVIVECSFDAYDWFTGGYVTKKAPELMDRGNGLFGNTSIVALPIVLFKNNQTLYPLDNHTAFNQFMTAMWESRGGVTVNDILSMWIYPFDNLSYSRSSSTSTTGDRADFYRIFEINGVKNANILESAIIQLPNRPSTLDTYTPRNKKLLTYPFCQMLISNNNGSAINLRFERFATPESPKGGLFFTSTSEGKVRLVPMNYDGMQNLNVDMSQAIDTAPYPLVSYLGDAYNIWMAQNRNTIANGFENVEIDFEQAQRQRMVSGTIGAAGQALGGNYGGALVSVATTDMSLYDQKIDKDQTINSMLAKQEDIKLQPATARGIQSVGLSYQSGYGNFSIMSKTIDRVHAKSIDDYWTAYGYPIRQIQTVVRKTRQRFTYIKTVGAQCGASIPAKYKTEIEKIYDTGVRFWADKNAFGNLNLDNPPL